MQPLKLHPTFLHSLTEIIYEGTTATHHSILQHRWRRREPTLCQFDHRLDSDSIVPISLQRWDACRKLTAPILVLNHRFLNENNKQLFSGKHQLRISQKLYLKLP